MATNGGRVMAPRDSLHELARYYDRIMDHVNYDRWFIVASALAELLPRDFVHLDAACGTGTLLKKLQRAGWNSVGIDLSHAMLHAGKKDHNALPVAAADLRAVPLRGSIDYVTCLFDSLNFLLELTDLERAFKEISGAMMPHGLFYFDVVTERMVMQHYEGQEWTENNGPFSTTWTSVYSRRTLIAETSIQVDTGAEGLVRERIYSREEIEQALRAAGFVLLGAFDAHSWKAPRRRTIRIDFVAAKAESRFQRRHFENICTDVRVALSALH